MNYDEILKLYDEGDFELFDLKNDLYYQLFYSYPETKEESWIKIYQTLLTSMKAIY